MKLYKCTHTMTDNVMAYFLMAKHAKDYQSEFFDGDILVEEIYCEVTENNQEVE